MENAEKMHSPQKVLYKQDELPVFQNRVYDSVAEARDCPTGNMCLVQDRATGLIYNKAFRPELVVYDAAYQNEQGVSRLFQSHLLNVAEIVGKNMGTQDLVEIGCGKGLFLEMLLSDGFGITGFDPAYEGSNPRVLRQFFEPGVGMHAKGLILRHVLEHISNPIEFLQQLCAANGRDGLIYIEVPCFDWICEHRTWFDVFYEHVNYFRLSDFHRIFDNVIASGKIFGGQYLYIVAELASVRVPSASKKDEVDFPDDFTDRLALRNPFWTSDAAVWGGASKGVIFSVLKERLGQPVKMVIDINPAKQGKFLALTGLKVESPADALGSLPAQSIIYIMNSHYLEEIKQISNNQYNYITVDHD